MNTSLTRSIGFWLLVLLSLASAAVGGWIVSGQLATMTTTLLDGTATGVEVYVGQSLVVVGAALVGAGVLGVLVALALTAVQSLIPRTPPVAVEAVDWTAHEEVESTATATADADGLASTDEPSDASAEAAHPASDVETTDDEDAQNGSSGSIATATKINVK